MSKIDTNEYLKLLLMNVSIIIKDNQELLNNNININEGVEQNNIKKEKENHNNVQGKEFNQVNLRLSNFAKIDEDELLPILTNEVEEELKKYFKKNLNLMNVIKVAKESDDNESSKTFIKNII